MNPMTGNAISVWIAELGIWPLIVVLVPNLMFRRYGQSAGKKRMASLFQAIAVFAITTAAAFIAERGLTDLYLGIAIAIVAVVLYMLRERVFPYRFTCVECDAKLDSRTIYFMDDNLCTSCHSAKSEREEAEAAGDELAATGVTNITEEETGSAADNWPGSASSADGEEEDTDEEES